MKIINPQAVIVGKGRFPSHAIPLQILHDANVVICCDGAAHNLLEHDIEPTAIIGDIDSLNKEVKAKYKDIIFHSSDQNTNDQTKAVEWAIAKGYTSIIILGATGLREDHAIGNISLLALYGRKASIQIVSNYGVFTPIYSTHTFTSTKGQQVSIFSLHPNAEISSENLEYPLQNLKLTSWWMGTLNEATSNTFTLRFKEGELIVFQTFDIK